MKNPIRIERGIAFIGLTSEVADGAEAIVDAADLPRLRALGHQWTIARMSGIRYVKCCPVVDGKAVNLLLHRFITNAPEGMVVDHINRDGLDNRRCNLRVVTQVENSQNRAVLRANTATGIKNVNYLRGEAHKRNRYVVRIMHRGVNHHFGVYPTLEAAAKAAEVARISLHLCCPENSGRH